MYKMDQLESLRISLSVFDLLGNTLGESTKENSTDEQQSKEGQDRHVDVVPVGWHRDGIHHCGDTIKSRKILKKKKREEERIKVKND